MKPGALEEDLIFTVRPATSQQTARPGLNAAFKTDWREFGDSDYSTDVIYSGSNQDSDSRDCKDKSNRDRISMTRERRKEKRWHHRHRFLHLTHKLLSLFQQKQSWWLLEQWKDRPRRFDELYFILFLLSLNETCFKITSRVSSEGRRCIFPFNKKAGVQILPFLTFCEFLH